MTRLILDAGPLVSILSTRDEHHRWMRRLLESVEPPLFTCDAAVSEACFLLGVADNAHVRLVDLVVAGVVAPTFGLLDEAAEVRRLMARYASVPMSLADACLVRMTELDARAAVVTFDGDFRIYRRNGRHVVPVMMP